MKLTVLNWIKDETVPFLGRLVELTFRIVLFLLPLGVFILLLQNRAKVSKVSNISVYTTAESVWQHVFPGFILVAIDPGQLKKFIANKKSYIQGWLRANLYLLLLLFASIVILLLSVLAFIL